MASNAKPIGFRASGTDEDDWENAARMPIRAPRKAGWREQRDRRSLSDVGSGAAAMKVFNYWENTNIKIFIS